MHDTPRQTTGDLFASLRRLSDDALVARLKSLAGRERRATALLVAHIAELDTRDVHLRAGYSSLFIYSRDALALSDGEAYNRIEAARAARCFPVILELLASGELSLTGARLLAPHLTPENHAAVLAAARGHRKAEIEEIVASLSPRADVPASVRKLPQQPVVSPAPSAGADPAPSSGAGPAPGVSVCSPSLAPRSVDASHSQAETAASRSISSAHPGQRAEVRPLSPDRYRYQLTIGGATLEKLRLAKDMLRHAVPSGDDEVILDRALTALLAELARRKFGARTEEGTCRNELPSPACPPEAAVPVAASDGSRGERKGQEERSRVTVDDIELRCARHEGDEICRFSAGDAASRDSRVGLRAAARRHV